LSREFAWTPDQIDRLTLQELDHYFAQSHIHRQTVAPPDVSLERLRRALYAFMGAKEPSINGDSLEQQIAKMKPVQINEDELRAWTAAGMPSPPEAFFQQYRREHR